MSWQCHFIYDLNFFASTKFCFFFPYMSLDLWLMMLVKLCLCVWNYAFSDEINKPPYLVLWHTHTCLAKCSQETLQKLGLGQCVLIHVFHSNVGKTQSPRLPLCRLSAPAAQVPGLGRRRVHRGGGLLLRGHLDHLLCNLCVHPVPWYACG